MNISDAGLKLIKDSEGLRLKAYQDSVGVWTIGYGHTPSHEGDTITQEEADTLFAEDIAKFADGVDNLIADSAGETDNEFGAMVSLAYNVGLGNFKHSTVLREHNAGNYQAAADAFRM